MTGSAVASGQERLPPAWYRQVAAVFFRHGWLKAIGTTVFISLFFYAYFYLLRNQAYPATEMPLTWFDRLIDVQPLGLPVYVSMWIYVSLPPALLGTRRELLHYGLAIGATCLAGLLIFYFWPTTTPPANIDWARFPELGFLKGIDANGNACPSLHVATSVFSAVWLHHLLRRFGGPSWILAGNWAWCIAIAYSTLAIRQHVALDVLGGIGLGLPAAWLSLRQPITEQRSG